MKLSFSAVKPHLLAILVFAAISIVYFPSMIEGKKIAQSDVQGYKGMSKEIDDYRDQTGEEALWTNSMFSGMPAYLISVDGSNNILVKLHSVLVNLSLRPAIHVFLYLIGFYILLLCFGVAPMLSVTGAVAYAFSTYFFVILEPGHLTKAMALGYLPMIIGSVYFTFKKDILIGGILTSIFLGLQLVANHLQITYYTLLILLIFGVFELFNTIISKSYRHFFTSIAVLLVAVLLAVSVNIVNFWTIREYSQFSLRGPSELSSDSHDKTSGLDKGYATAWSYGIDESLNLLIPNFKGGASNVLIADRNSKTFDFLSKSSTPQNAMNLINQNAYFFTQYWGTQPGTSGPVYIGAAVIFLFVFGMFFSRSKLKWWLFSVVVFSLLLSWGRNFMPLTDFFLDYFPGYNKFRTVSMILVMAEFAFPLLAILTIQEMVVGTYTKKRVNDSLKWSLIIVGGIALLFTLFPGLSNLNAPKDEFLISQGASDLVSVIKEDRARILSKDAFRSLVFIVLAAGVVFAYVRNKFNPKLLYLAFALLFLFDLWPINKRYLNKENFVPKRSVETAFQPYQADIDILKDKDPYYRVYDLTASDPFASSRASYFHKSIGGYHGAKIRRYQDVFNTYMSNGINQNILDMLNTKYLITVDQKTGQPTDSLRKSALGNAWFVKDYKIVSNADEELRELGSIDPSKTAVINVRFKKQVENREFSQDSLSSIKLTAYAPNHLTYSYKAIEDKLAVFSEIYYDAGWQASINGIKSDYFRADYILRAMVIPKGDGTIEFEFKPNSYFIGRKIAFGASVLMVLLVAFGIWYRGFRPKKVN